jgi:hypothetical protein
MKRVLMCLVIVILAASFAGGQDQKGFSVTVDIDADLGQFTRREIKNDEYISEEDTVQENEFRFMNNDKFGDAEVTFEYTDPDDKFGAVIGVDFADALGGVLPLGDLYGWGRISKYSRVQLGKYTYRVIEKLDGDKDLGVLNLVLDKGENSLFFESRDSLAQNADIIGFLGSGILGIPGAGTVELGVFAAPDNYYVARYYDIPGSTTGSEPKQKVPAYYTYNFGGILKYSLENVVTVGASYRQIHTEGEGTSTGYIHNDYGIYAVLDTLNGVGVRIAAGYSGNISFEDGDDLDTAPIQHAIHLDAEYTGVPKLKIGLYNNFSFYGLAADKTLTYDSDIAEVLDIYADESSKILYNELKASYELTESLIPGLIFRNYYGSLTGINGVKGQDYGLDVFTGEARMTYKIKTAEFRAGLKFGYTLYNTPAASDILRNSGFTVSLPVGLAIKW